MRLLEQLRAEIARGPVAAARAARDAVAADVEAAVEIADNAAVDMRARVAALLAIALVGADGGVIPESALVALEDDLLVDAVLEGAVASALTGIVHSLRDRIADPLRRYLALRIAAAGVTGIHVADLLVSVGELDAAVRAATPTLISTLRDVAHDDPVALALATIIVDWTRKNASLDAHLALRLPELQRAKLALSIALVRDARPAH